MYAGLTPEDKKALLDAKARGAEWVARDKNIVLGGFKHEPVRKTIVLPNGIPSMTTWNDEIEDFWIELDDCDLSFVTWSLGAVNIDLALSQIAEMAKSQKPLTWNERINQMTVEEKARFIYSMDEYVEDYGVCVNALVNNLNWRCMKFDFPVKTTDLCVKCFINWLNSPYTEGEAK